MQNGKTKKTKLALKYAPIVVIAVASVVFIIIAIMSQNVNLPTIPLSVNDQTLTVELAVSTQEKSIGLCCRE